MSKRIISYLEENVKDKSISIIDYLEQVRAKQLETDKADEELNRQIIEQFTGVYLIEYTDDDSPFGKSINLRHIETVEFNAYTTDFERTYTFTGNYLSVNATIGTTNRKLSNTCQDSLTATQLQNMQVVSKEAYVLYERSINDINLKIKELLDTKIVICK